MIQKESSISVTSMSIADILEHLPHRYPFLLVDRVLDCQPGKSLTALKNVSVNEPFFPGHFPGQPIMPGVLIIEALAQAAGILAFKSETQQLGNRSMFYLVGIDNARFKRPVEPGDQLIMNVCLQRRRRGVGVFSCEAKVADVFVAGADLMCAQRTSDL